MPIGSRWHVVLRVFTVINAPRSSSTSRLEGPFARLQRPRRRPVPATACELRKDLVPQRRPGLREGRAERHRYRTPFQRKCNYFLVGGPAHSDLAHVYAVLSETAQKGPWRTSGRAAFCRAVLKIRSGKCQRLPDVFRFQLGIIPEKVVSVWIDGDGFHDPTHCQPHSTDARLTVHLVWVPRYRSHSDTFRCRVPGPDSYRTRLWAVSCPKRLREPSSPWRNPLPRGRGYGAGPANKRCFLTCATVS